MDQTPGLQSVFSQKLDRSVFATYFLGAIVPLLAFAFVIQRFVLPELEADSYTRYAVIGLIIGIALLSLGAFFALRKITRDAVSRMDTDNARLAKILDASERLAGAPHAHVVAETTAGCGLALTDADAAFVLLKSGADKPPVLCESAGAADLYQANEEMLQELAEEALGMGRVGSFAGTGSGDRIGAAVAIPLSGEGGKTSGALILARRKTGSGFSPDEVDVVSTLAAFTSVSLHNADLQDAQRNFFAHVTDLLVTALDAHVDHRQGHATRVAQLANRLGRALELSEDRLQRLHFASLLHDIGMLKIGRAQQRNASFFQKHPQIANRMLSRIRLWEEVAPIVLYHHEWVNGSGYPEGLSGDEIPLESRIIAVADAFDAMTRLHGEYKVERLDHAVSELREGSGTQFDPRVVEVFIASVERGEITVAP